jgi:hypothetical protein
MGRRFTDNPARRAWWQVHIDAQRKSGLTVARHCRQHGLTQWTFTKWRSELTDWEERKIQQKPAFRRRYRPNLPDKRRQATQAFWARHVEASQWSGLHLRDYGVGAAAVAPQPQTMAQSDRG